MNNFTKKLLCMILSVFCLCSIHLATVSAASLPFNDVAKERWYYNAIEYAYSNHLMTGITDTRFEPNTTLTRGMFVTILGRMAGVNENDSNLVYSQFRDVKSGKWYTSYVVWASKNGIVSGFTDTYFGVNDTISREQMATILYRYLERYNINLPYAKDKAAIFHDEGGISKWAKQGVEMLRRTGIMKGDINSHFNPSNSATRAEAATVFMNLHRAVLSGGTDEPAFVESSTIQEYKGKVYTVHSQMYDSANMVEIPNGNYLMSMAVYEDKIYYTEAVGTGGGPTSLYRMNLNGSGKQKLLSDIESWTNFCIYDDKLYYTASDWEGNTASKSMDINTLKMNYEPYYYLFGTEEVWVITDDIFYSNNYYCCSPGYIYGKPLPADSYWTDELVFGVHGDNMYYFMKYSLMKASVYNTTNTEFAAGPYIDFERHYLIGDGLYYFKTDNENILYRMDLNTGVERSYNVGSYLYSQQSWGKMYAFWPYREVNGTLYFKFYDEDPATMLNTKCFALNLNTGNVKEVGYWFES